ncbi:hypothetical protein HBB16_21880 [Pseudonocardia sp. MCCB 268]|nr:hypothetical protein [Pseudonocardia cytotoxica]
MGKDNLPRQAPGRSRATPSATHRSSGSRADGHRRAGDPRARRSQDVSPLRQRDRARHDRGRDGRGDPATTRTPNAGSASISTRRGVGPAVDDRAVHPAAAQWRSPSRSGDGGAGLLKITTGRSAPSRRTARRAELACGQPRPVRAGPRQLARTPSPTPTLDGCGTR